MSLEQYLDHIIDQNIINKILTPTKDSFPLGDFENYEEIPIEWTKNIHIDDFQVTYRKIDQFEKYVFIGMGGSISMARIASFINPSKILFIDNFDISQIKKIKKNINNLSTAVFICSKSSNTLETKILEQIISEKKCSIFYIQDGKNNDSKTLATPQKTGGRFSISTHLGILPFYLCGFKLSKIISNINKANDKCIKNERDNPALLIAGILLSNYKQSKNIFSVLSENKNDYITDWIEQLISESTGKEEKGILPLKNIKGIYPSISFSQYKDLFSENNINIKAEYNETLFYKFQVLNYAVAIFCTSISIQPFDQPNVESTKITTQNLLINNEEKKIEKQYKENQLYEEIQKSKGFISLLIHGTNLTNEQKEKMINLCEIGSNKNKRILIFFAPNYLHSMGQLLKGSFKNIHNLVINLHGNEDLNIPKSLYTLNTFVKKQGYSDHIEMIKNGRKSVYFETNYEELINNLSKLSND